MVPGPGKSFAPSPRLRFGHPVVFAVHVEIAISYAALNDPGEPPTVLPNGDYQFAVNTDNTCSAASKPPDWNPNTLKIPKTYAVPHPPVYWVGFTECAAAEVNGTIVGPYICIADLLYALDVNSPPNTTLTKAAMALLEGDAPWKGSIPKDCTNHAKLGNDQGLTLPPW